MDDTMDATAHIWVFLTLSRSVQHGMAAKMSYAYMVPSTSKEPSHFWAQNLREDAKTRIREAEFE